VRDFSVDLVWAKIQVIFTVIGGWLDVIGTGSALRSAVIFFYLSNEGLSLLENAAHLGLPVPDKLKDVLVQLHNRSDKDNITDTADPDNNDVSK